MYPVAVFIYEGVPMAIIKFTSYLIFLLTEHNIFNSNVRNLYKIQLYG